MKKLIGALLIGALFVLNSSSVLAIGPNGVPTNSEISVAEQLAELENPDSPYTEGEKQEMREKLLHTYPSAYSSPDLTRAAILIHLNGFTCYTQLHDNYCMPATAKSVIQYFNGSSDTQDDIALEMEIGSSGGDFSVMRPYLNSHQTENNYVYIPSFFTQTRMANDFYAAIVDYDAPVVMRIFSYGTAHWGYETDTGHALAVIGITSDKEDAQMADPWMEYAGLGNNIYLWSLSETYEVVNMDGCGYLY